MLETVCLECCDGVGACWKTGEYCAKERGRQQERNWNRKEGIVVGRFMRKPRVGELKRYHNKWSLSRVKHEEMGT